MEKEKYKTFRTSLTFIRIEVLIVQDMNMIIILTPSLRLSDGIHPSAGNTKND